MAGFLKITPLFLLLLLICQTVSSAENESKEELVESESKDGNIEIIKQIKKVNDDGSYTIGYEADDGSFKIESRDVLGNIKGTYGYLDDSGQIKRVSYSTSNSSEVLTKPEITSSSVVQKIPSKSNRTSHYTTKRPRPIYSTTQATPTSTTALQRIALERLAKLSTTTTEKPNYSEVVNMESELSKTTNKPRLIFPSSTPKILLQSRPIVRSTPATQLQKSEGQILRPEVATARPTELPLFRRLALKQHILGESKAVVEEPEIRSNILRRQLSPEKLSGFDPEQHVFTLQQSLGNDATDVYSGSVTTGTPRPLFTTTTRPRAFLSSTTTPTVVSKPTVRYPTNYPRNDLHNIEVSTPEYAQETTTTEATTNQVTPTPVPIVQIPANRAIQDPLVAIRHPFQRGTILVPLSQLQGRVVPLDLNQAQYVGPNEQYVKEPTPKPVPEVERRPVLVQRIPPPQFRPIPVQVDENGFIREVARPPNVPPTPYPLPLPITPGPKYVENDVENDIEDISPPVSTRDFQKLLHLLILRQRRLERISAITDPRRYPEYYQPRYRPAYRPTPAPYYVQRIPDNQQTGPVQFLPADDRQRQYVPIPAQQQVSIRQQQRQEDLYEPNGQSYVPTRRVARLLQPNQQRQQENKEEYLPPDVREMLLLRMLQLAINPALPVNEDEMAESTTTMPQYKKVPVKNVEILGEESEEEKRSARNKRYREFADYYQK